jgi:hypothetical protein
MKNINNYNWYECPKKINELVAINAPRLDDEFLINSDTVTILITEIEIVSKPKAIISFIFKNQFIPVNESGELFIKYNGSLASRKVDDTLYLGILKNEG